MIGCKPACLRSVVTAVCMLVAHIGAQSMGSCCSATWSPYTTFNLKQFSVPPAVAIGTQATFSADAEDIDTRQVPPAAPVEVPDSLTYTWSVQIPGGGAPQTLVGQQVTWTAPSAALATPVAVTLTIHDAAIKPPLEGGTRDDNPDFTRTAQVKVFGGSPWTDQHWELRWYCGSPVPAKYKSSLRAAENQPSGTTYTWNVNSPGNADPVKADHTLVSGIGPSSSEQDIAVTLTYECEGVSWTNSPSYNYTSYQPSSVHQSGWATDFVMPLYGYTSQLFYYIEDQFHTQMLDIGAAEEFGAKQDDVTNTWPAPNITGGSNGTGDAFTDTYGPFDPFGLLYPPPGMGTQLIFHIQQKYWANNYGSTYTTGCMVSDHVVNFYQNRARW